MEASRAHCYVAVAVADRIIAQRELRNDVATILRAAEAGETFTVTVHGRPVARVVPVTEVPRPRTDVGWEAVAELLSSTRDPELLRELDQGEAPLDG